MADSILIGHFTNRAIQESYNHARYERERGLEKKVKNTKYKKYSDLYATNRNLKN